MGVAERPEVSPPKAARAHRLAARPGGRAGAPGPWPPLWARRYHARAVAIDLACGFLAGAAAVDVRFGQVTPYVTPYLVLSSVLPVLWVCLLGLNRAYESRLVGVGSEEFRRISQCGFLLTAGVAIAAYVTKTDLARGYVVLALPLMTFLTLCCRYGLRRRLHAMRARGWCMRRVVAVGHREALADLIRHFRAEPYHGMDVVGVCLPREDGPGEVEGAPVLGDFTDVPLAVCQAGADTVAVLACPELDGTALRRLAWRLEKTRTDLVVAPALMEVAGPRTTIRPVAGLPLLHVEHPELAGARRLVKNLFDRTVAALALALLAPLLAALAVAVRATSPGPALFRQTRVGRDGVEFTILKLRTMGADAEHRKIGLASDVDGLLFKIRDDPRVTPLGGWLRRRSLDELPQLFNVLAGHMSLVGPRPPLPEEVAGYGDDVRRRLVVRPGMTGLWQVNGRSDLSWEESVRLDLRYVENWSLTLDLQILWKTWSAVARGSGAY
ncbi:exopolysaccharide biosynthesis polyprenyl glycosylphosphotransferase [Sphaerisporangium siamense]|uniref:Exopolysaccharide biosynthesis polyprenyl glycosylphosphotransferase n=1 Tax=Sphaerisporangium siamense TaxID=795645 RepID=A0A7W7G9P3_9ACTN|nr:sugar transferase [Sphaerisporangium siamense]MBB4700734.1 exopolysaccharide biosynthesis polyprenyl glycosylphosphotransferase [Sphaerisporangium siamense]GII88783.1 exopolysaccharide biosynthesis polyprenyl glycosylphosphotransferase [Sphaerisporangium siamense]